MAIYHLSAQVVQRSKGRSSVAAAAYRCGMRFTDARTGLHHDFSKRTGVDFVQTVAPANAPEWVHNPCSLWNAVEAVEKRKDAQTAREINLAIPRELSPAQMRATVIHFAQQNFAADGMVATVAFHDLDSGNPHAHIMLTTREITPEGFGNKRRDWNATEKLEAWRESWALTANAALRLAGQSARIDHRSNAARGIEAEPGRHLGPQATAMQRRGATVDRVRELVADAYEYAREVVVGFTGRLLQRRGVEPGPEVEPTPEQRARRSPHFIDLTLKPPRPVPPWMKPPR